MQGMDEDKAEEFEMEIGMIPDPSKDAREALLAHQRAAGINIEDPDAPVGPDAKSIALAEDEEIKDTFMGNTSRARHR
jgi:hypothetical protein